MRLRRTALLSMTALVTVGSLLLGATPAGAAPTEVTVHDGSGDVATEGTVSQRTKNSADISYTYVYRDNDSGRVEFQTRVDDGAPLSTEEGSTNFLISLRVTQKPKIVKLKNGKKKKVRLKPYKIVLDYTPNEPIDPLRIRSNKSGEMNPLFCADTAVELDDGFTIYEAYIAMAPSCFGKRALNANGSVLVTSTESGGGVARDGLSLPLFSVD